MEQSANPNVARQNIGEDHHRRPQRMQTLIVLASILSLIAAYVPKSEHKLDAEAESEIGKGVNLVVGHSTIPGAGRGVFAARDMKSCERVEKAEAIPCVAHGQNMHICGTQSCVISPSLCHSIHALTQHAV